MVERSLLHGTFSRDAPAAPLRARLTVPRRLNVSLSPQVTVSHSLPAVNDGVNDGMMGEWWCA